MMQRSWICGLFVAIVAAGCGDDGEAKDTRAPDSEVSETTPEVVDEVADSDAPDDTAADASDASDASDVDDADAADDVDDVDDVDDEDTADGDDTSDTSDTSEPDTTVPPRVYDPIPGRWSDAFDFSLPGLQADNGPRAYDMIRVGDAVIVGGNFDRIGDLHAANVARWSAGDGWSALGDGPGVTVHALVADEAGALYAGGRAESGGFGVPGPGPVARWDGEAWTPIAWLDAFTPVWSLAWIDGSLYAGGEFTSLQSADQSETIEAAYLARWDGTSWNAIPGGPDGPVHAIAKHGDAICVGGSFSVPGTNVACLGPEGWRALGDGLNSEVHVLYSDTDRLLAGGYFSFGDPSGPPTEFFVGLGRFNDGGTAWAPLAGGVIDGFITNVWEIAPADDGGLWIGGNFSAVNAAAPRPARNFARLTGNAWSEVGAVDNELGVVLGSEVGVRAVVPDGEGFFVAGLFSVVGDVTALNIARFEKSVWSPVVTVSGPNLGVAGNVNSLSYGPDGSLFVGGYFSSAGGATTPNVARFGLSRGAPNAIIPVPPEAPAWHSLGAGLDGTVWVVHAAADGKVYAGGLFANGFARWNGPNATAWDFPAPMDGDVRAVAEAGSALYVGGTFTMIGLDARAHIAKFTGSAFEALGPGLNDRVNAVAVAPDGSVYAGGFFSGSGDYDAEAGKGVALAHIARWNGASWEDVGGGLDGYVRDMAWWGDDLIVVGEFALAGEVPVSSIARWDGAVWSPIGEGTEWVYSWGSPLQLGAVAVQDNGLFVTGAFVGQMIGDATFNGIAWWNGSAFEPLSEGPNDLVEDVVITPDRRGAFIGGGFLRVDGNPSLGLGLWEYDDLIGVPATSAAP